MATPPKPPPVPPPEPPPTRRRALVPALVVEDFRSVRRWLIVLGVLAVVATAVAAYAILQSGESADDDRVEALETQLLEVNRQQRRSSRQRDLQEQELEQRLGRASEEADVAKLERRLRGTERDLVGSINDNTDNGRRLDRLDERIDTLSERVDGFVESLRAQLRRRRD